VLSVCWRNNPILLAKQMASVEQISGGRLTAGLGLGGWPEDFSASLVSPPGKARLWESTLAAMWQVWAGKMSGQAGPMPELPEGRPALLFGGLVPSAYKRAARHGQGWVAPLFGLSALQESGSRTRGVVGGGTAGAAPDRDRALLQPR
jgi:alkanesulfonate monooxygenase SsuD/methylene tetrahydromethanopterin reductase-like flavin-dependent oxidoreductase (luciferase family)